MPLPATQPDVGHPSNTVLYASAIKQGGTQALHFPVMKEVAMGLHERANASERERKRPMGVGVKRGSEIAWLQLGCK